MPTSLQAFYLSRLESRPANKQSMLKVTERLLLAKPDLLPEYVEVAKGEGTPIMQSNLPAYTAICTSIADGAPASWKHTHLHLGSTPICITGYRNSHCCCELPADSPGLMYAVLHYGSQHRDQGAPYQQDLLHTYCDTVLGAKTPVPAEKLNAYSPLLAQLTEEQFKGTILPAVLKFVKRTPEAALNSTVYLFLALRLDLSSSASDIVDQMVKLIRGSKESVR